MLFTAMIGETIAKIAWYFLELMYVRAKGAPGSIGFVSWHKKSKKYIIILDLICADSSGLSGFPDSHYKLSFFAVFINRFTLMHFFLGTNSRTAKSFTRQIAGHSFVPPLLCLFQALRSDHDQGPAPRDR